MTQALQSLLGDLVSVDRRVRRTACNGLGWLRDQRAVEPLLQHLADDWEVRNAACEALWKLRNERVVEPLLPRPLLPRLLDGTPWPVMRRDVYRALSKLEAQRAVEPLLRCLAVADWLVQDAVCGALERLGEGRLAKALLGVVHDEYRELGCLATEEDLRAVEPMTQWLDDFRAKVRLAACHALSIIGKKLAPRFPQLLCRSCLTRFKDKVFRVGLSKARWVACRICGRAAEAVFDVRDVVAVLDGELDQEFECVNGVACVNWLQWETLFDFDRVEIVRTNEYEVERLCIQVSNDIDAFRRPRYRKMSCTVDPQSGLSQSALNMLRHTFGKVSVELASDTRTACADL